MSRWHVGCDACGAEAWIGGRAGGWDAWCEACQSPLALPREPSERVPCPRCGAAVTTRELRFEELYGELQHLAVVLSAWMGDPAPLDALLPERPRFLTDLNPPEPLDGDDPETVAALAALATGAFGAARRRLEALLERQPDAAPARLWQGLGIAAERQGDLALAEAAFTRALGGEAEAIVRLSRGALRARRGAFAEAREDFAVAGETREARWNRAALRVFEAVATTPGLPEPGEIDAARDEAGPPSSYWSDHTVGRLLWTLLVERAESRPGREVDPLAPAACADARVLRAAESQFEFATFWDRALVLDGYATLGLTEDTTRVAAELARELAEELRADPCLLGSAAAPIATAVAAANTAIRDGAPATALSAVQTAMERDDVRHYRIPCARCGTGSIGVDRVEDDEGHA
jgi:tetratricopeptide (TPR) repeat protein